MQRVYATYEKQIYGDEKLWEKEKQWKTKVPWEESGEFRIMMNIEPLENLKEEEKLQLAQRKINKWDLNEETIK